MSTLDQSFTTNDSDIPIGGTNIFGKTAQSFTVSANGEIDNVDIYIKKIGSPTDNVTVAIYSDSGGLPNVAISSVESFAASGIGASLGWKNVVFSSKVNGVAGTKYHIVCIRSGSVDSSNYIAWGYRSSGGYSGGSASNWNNSNGYWTDLGGGDCNFKEYYNPALVINASFLLNMV